MINKTSTQIDYDHNMDPVFSVKHQPDMVTEKKMAIVHKTFTARGKQHNEYKFKPCEYPVFGSIEEQIKDDAILSNYQNKQSTANTKTTERVKPEIKTTNPFDSEVYERIVLTEL